MPELVEFEEIADPAPRRSVTARRLRVSAYLAWRILTHEKGRTALALAGVFIAILLVFIELGFFVAVPQVACWSTTICVSTCCSPPATTSFRRSRGNSLSPG